MNANMMGSARGRGQAGGSIGRRAPWPATWRAAGSAVVLAATLAFAGGLPGVALAGPGAHGPDGEHLDAPTVATPDSLARLPDGSVNLPVPAQRRMGVRTVLAPITEAAATLELPGRVVVDPNASGRVQAVTGGRLLPGPRGLPVPGQAVRKGEVLALVVFNPNPLEVASQRAQIAEIRSALPLVRARLARLETLEGTVPRREIEAARAELASLEAREAALGAGVAATEALVAPVSGVIARADAVAGQVVEPRDLLFEVVDPSRLLVEASTPDPSVAGRLAGATLAGQPQVTLQLLGAARTLRDGVLPITFRARVAGPLPLAVGQPVTVVATLSERVRGIVLPAQAVTRSPANEPVVWIKGGAERYVPQPVQVRPLDAHRVVVIQGLAADQRVVVEGASLIAQIR